MSAPGYERGEKLPSGSYAGSGGKPSSYDPSYCEKVLEWGALGKSRTWMAAEIGISRDALYGWMHEHPEFEDALKRAKALEQKWWEDAGQNGMFANLFNGGVWGRNMGSRFQDEWRETTRQENTGANGGPVQVQTIERVIVDKGNEGLDSDA